MLGGGRRVSERMHKFRALLCSLVAAVVALQCVYAGDPITETDAPRPIVLCSLGTSFTDVVPMFEYGKELKTLGYKIIFLGFQDSLDWAAPYDFDILSAGHDTVSIEARRDYYAKLSADEWGVQAFAYAKHKYHDQHYEEAMTKVASILNQVQPEFMIADMNADLCTDLATMMRIPLGVSVHYLGYESLGSEKPYLPNTLLGYPRRMSYLKRFYNCAFLPLEFGYHFLQTQGLLNNARKRAKVPTTIYPGGNWRHALRFVNSFSGFEYPQPLDPFARMTGPVLRTVYPPLRTNIDTWLSDRASQGQMVLYVSFGTDAILSAIQVTKIVDAISCAKAYALWDAGSTPLWHFPTPLPPFIMLINTEPDEVPQAPITVLNHTAIKGALLDGSSEAMYISLVLGKPLVAIPFFGVAISNAAKLADWGAAAVLDKNSFSSSDLCQKLVNLTDTATSRPFVRMHLLAEYHSRGAAAEVARYIDMVLKTGPVHLVRMDTLQPVTQWFNIDVYSSVLVVLYWLYRVIVNGVSALRKDKKSEKETTEAEDKKTQ